MTASPHFTTTVLWCLAVLAGCSHDNKSKPTAWLRIETPVSPLSEKWKPTVGTAPLDDESEKYVAQLITLIRTPMVLEDAARSKSVARIPEVRSAADPTKWLAERITVDRVRNSHIVKVSFQHSDPEVAANVTNAIASSFFKLHQQESEGREKHLLDGLGTLPRANETGSPAPAQQVKNHD